MTVKDTDLAWLAGAIEGDGSIGMGFHVFGNRRGQSFAAKPSIDFSNQDEGLILHVGILIEQICGKTPLFATAIKSGFKKNAPVHRIRLAGMAEVLTVLEAISPYLIGDKSGRANLIMKFIRSRLADTHQAQGSGRRPYNEHEREIIRTFYERTNRKGGKHNTVVVDLLKANSQLN